MGYKVEVCPRCGRERMLNALSRRDNKTMICLPCGTIEACIDMNISISRENMQNEKNFIRKLKGMKANE